MIDIHFSSAFGTMHLRDMDGDGRLDLTVPSNDDSVLVYRNLSTPGNIQFAAPLFFDHGEGGNASDAADLDGDGRDDLAVACFSSYHLALLRNTSTPGNISFGKPVNFRTTGPTSGVVLDDIDGDGKRDLITLSDSASSLFTNVAVFRNNSTPGNLTFGARIDLPVIREWAYAHMITATDFDGDGRLDITVTGFDTLSVFRNTSTPGNISFQPYFSVPVRRAFEHSVIDNFSGDGKPDIIVAEASTSGLKLVRNTSVPGTIQTDAEVAVNSYRPYDVASGDFNLDGKVDLLVTSAYQYMTIYANNVNGFTSMELCTNGSTQLYSDVTGTSYQWQQDLGSGYVNIANGTVFSGVTNNTLFINGFPASMNNSKLRCVVNGNLYSTPMKITLLTYPKPVVAVTASSTSSCAGSNVTFTASGSNWGANPFIQWYVNGNYVYSGSPVFNTGSLGNGAVVQARITNNDSFRCTSYSFDTSLRVVMTVRPVNVPVATISGNTIVAAGNSSLITAAAVNAGTTPTYQWSDSTSALGWRDINGATAASISYAPPADGARLRCRVGSNAPCAAPSSVYTNTLTFNTGTTTALPGVLPQAYGITWYPVPARTALHINNLRAQDKWETLLLLAADGSTVRRIAISGLRTVTLALVGLPSGMYTVCLEGRNAHTQFPVVH
ncbi:MAG: VCBS repeat-containing protein [Chitinophagaceae bacterium]|nr:MAG: VCBS repeat-containing protein [Chitinophagaceae bacterium]